MVPPCPAGNSNSDKSLEFDDSVNMMMGANQGQEETNLQFAKWLDAQKTNNYLSNNPNVVSQSRILPTE